MTKRERFEKFLANEPVDRVPVAFFHHFCPPSEWGQGVVNPDAFERNIIGHKYALEKFDPDVAKIMNDTLMIMPVDVSFVKTPDDLRRVHAPALDSDFVKKTLELTKRVRAIYADCDAPIYATGFSPSMVLRNSMCSGGIPGESDEKWVKDLIEADPEAFSAAIKNLADEIAVINELLIKEGGVDGIYLSVNNQNNFFTDDFFRTYIAPHEQEMLRKANELSKINLLHICGYHGRSNHLYLFTEYEAAAYNIAVYAEGVSLSEGRKLFGGKPVFGGFSQDGVIYTGTKEEVKKAAWDILDECGQVGIMLGDDCTVPNDIDDSRLNWVREAAIEYAEAHK